MLHVPALLRRSIITCFAVSIPISGVAQGPAIEWTTLPIRAGEGQREVPFGRLRVPENHAEPDGPAITLAFVRLPSTSARPGPPLIYLAGGPGGSAIGEAAIPYLFSLFEALRAVGDVILLDQRGTGRSSPNLSCRGETAPPLDLFLSEATLRAHLRRGIEACAELQRVRQVRAQYYTTSQSADDIEAVRRALGAERIRLLGFSYGTHLGLSVIRRHGDRIERAVLAGVEGPDHSEKWPSVMDLQLERLAQYAREDTTVGRLAPDLVGTLRTLLDRLEREPARVPSTDQPAASQLVVGRAGFQYLLYRDLGDTNDWPILPGLIVTAANGEYGLLGQFARRRWNQHRGTSLMSAAMVKLGVYGTIRVLFDLLPASPAWAAAALSAVSFASSADWLTNF